MIITRENVFEHVTKTVNEFNGAQTFTSNDGKLKIVAHRCVSDHSPRGLMTLWKKHGYIEKELDTYVHIETCYDEDEYHHVCKYNATVKRDLKNHRDSINFDYLKEWADENIIDIVIACLNMRENNIEAIYI